jgi:prepilin-type N-terminal cleavage/methylation domain-containing protein
MRRNGTARGGFTLIELSIVLVIIGLIVGAVLVGQDLIRAAGVRAQISQIEKYNTAVNTFRVKYGSLPGDINATAASQFGFAPRGQYAGEGDGNGVIEGNNSNGAGNNNGTYESMGETVMFWVDLSQVGLIEGSFNAATSNVPLFWPSNMTATSTPNLNAYFPPAKVGTNWVVVYSFNGINYFEIGNFSSFGIQPNGPAFSTQGLTVQQAYSIDKKMDDGLPQSGNVTTKNVWNGVNWIGAWPGTAAGASSTTCYDNGGNASNPMQYSLPQNGGAGVNCVLSFQFQ